MISAHFICIYCIPTCCKLFHNTMSSFDPSQSLFSSLPPIRANESNRFWEVKKSFISRIRL